MGIPENFIGVKHILINDLWFLFGILGSNPFISWLCKVTISFEGADHKCHVGLSENVG